MKAITIIIAAVLALQLIVPITDNYETRTSVNGAFFSYKTNTVDPVTTIETTFENATEKTAFDFDFSVLAPVTPVESDFLEIVPEKNIDLTALAPVTPAEADFSDSVEDQAIDFSALAPMTPAEADFE